VLLNHKVNGGNSAKNAIMSSPKLKQAIAEAEKKLHDSGRVLIRPSGTEALIRVMVEAKSEDKAVNIAEGLVNLIKML
jgi:phosphoglucosamine mutase